MSYGHAPSYHRAPTYPRPTATKSHHETPAHTSTALPADLDLSAPVIHFGTTGPMPRERLRQQQVDFVPSQTLHAPPSRQQKMHSIWVGGCPAEILDDYWMERILKAAGKLRGWNRATDALDRPRAFGFAEYDDPEHVKRAYLILQDLAIKLPPSFEGRTLQLQATVDEGGALYIEDFLAARTIKDVKAKDAASLKQGKAAVAQVLRDLASPKFKRPDKHLKDKAPVKSIPETPSATAVATGPDPGAVTIMLSADDELGDIPEEQRRYIADEITGFRTRSAKRDADRQRQVADVEVRRAAFERAAKAAAPAGAELSARHVAGAKEETIETLRPRRDRHTPAERLMTDEAIRASRAREAAQALAPRLAEAERRLLQREKLRIAHQARLLQRAEGDLQRAEEDRAHAARKYAAYEDAREASRGVDAYFDDFGGWRRARRAYRAREMQADEEDAEAERREEQAQQAALSAAVGQQNTGAAAAKVAEKQEVAPVRLTLATKQAEKKIPAASARLRTTEDEEAEEEEAEARKRRLVPLRFEEEEARAAKVKRIVEGIPVDKDALWAYPVPWQNLSTDGLQDKLRVFVAKKCVEAIGVEAEELIEFVAEHVASQGSPGDLEQEMVSAMGDAEEAEAFTVKCWRYLLILLETATL